MFNGITIAFFAGCAGLFALVSPLFGELDLTAAVMGVGLGLVGFNEFKGRRLIRNFDPRGPRVLGWNQVCLMVLLIAYSAWMIAKTYLSPNPYATAIAEESMLTDTLQPLSDLYLLLTLCLYGGVIVGTIIFQGLNAVYYFTRTRYLRAYLGETPDWVIDVQRRSAAG